jgi:protein-L-isoaspartate(D-aspartate) O-methyltransferase
MSGFAAARQKMVDGQVRPSDVTDIRIIDAMLTVPREAFVPRSKQALAYLDLDLDVSENGPVRRCLIKPAVIAKLLQAAEIQSTDHVLVAGCATAYVAALAARIAARVTALENDTPLAAEAQKVLAGLGVNNVTVKAGATADGDDANAPFDVIFLCGATEIAPERLYGQLAEGGRLVGISAAANPPRAVLVTRSSHDFGSRPLFDATAPVLPGLARTPGFVF